MSRLAGLATAILTIVGLFLLPGQVAAEFNSFWGQVVGLLAVLILGAGAAYHLTTTPTLARFGLGRYKSDFIVSEKLERIQIDKEYRATVSTSKLLIFLQKPESSDLVDLIETFPHEEIDETVYSSSDSTIVDVTRRNPSNVAIQWAPKSEIIPLVPYLHATRYTSPSLYGPDGFWQGSLVDRRTGRVEWTFTSANRMVRAVAFRVPPWRKRLTERWVSLQALYGKRRGCEQPILSSDGHTLLWTQVNPTPNNVYILFAFFEGGEHTIAADLKTKRFLRGLASRLPNLLLQRDR